MIRFVVERLLSAIALLLGVTVVAFLLLQVVPSNAVYANIGSGVTDPAVIETYRQNYGLDQPLPIRYWRYISRLSTGDFGVSTQTGRPVAQDLGAYIPATLEIAIPALFIALSISLVLGLISGLRSGGVLDQSVRVGASLSVSTPPFWLALIALYLIAFKGQWLPTGGRLGPEFSNPPKITGMFTVDAALAGQWDALGDAARHLILPVAILAIFGLGFFTRFTRSAVLEVVNRDYVRTAWAKGLPPHTVILRHILRPSLLPIVTVAGLAFGSLLAGAVLVERVFSWPGVGQYAYRSATGLDLPAIVGVALFVACAYIVVNFVVDILYGIIDPRIRLHE